MLLNTGGTNILSKVLYFIEPQIKPKKCGLYVMYDLHKQEVITRISNLLKKFLVLHPNLFTLYIYIT